MENDIAHKILHDRENGAAMLLSEYKSGLYSVALTLCHDSSEAEDLVFRAVERAISKIDTFQNHDSLYSWLCVILVNTYRDSTRKKVVSGTFAAGGAAEMESFTEPAGPESLVSEIDGGFVRQALESMPEACGKCCFCTISWTCRPSRSPSSSRCRWAPSSRGCTMRASRWAQDSARGSKRRAWC